MIIENDLYSERLSVAVVAKKCIGSATLTKKKNPVGGGGGAKSTHFTGIMLAKFSGINRLILDYNVLIVAEWRGK